VIVTIVTADSADVLIVWSADAPGHQTVVRRCRVGFGQHDDAPRSPRLCPTRFILLTGPMTTFDRPTLGKLIRRQRELTALPLRQVAAAVGISNAYLSQIERDVREHSERVLGAIADQLGLSPDILIAEANPSPLGRSCRSCARDSA
jgi:helix-turn-helix protein